VCCIAAHCASIVVAAIGATWARQAALSRVGPFLYERIFKHYTKKQWVRATDLRRPAHA
jgi:UDP-galactopyranose mutase